MKLKKLNIYTYSLPLIRALKMKGSEQNQRHGLVVELINEKGFKGFGDAAPFPGLHNESLIDIISESKISFSEFSHYKFDDHSDLFSQINLLPKCSPSLQFAMNWAYVDLFSKSRKINPGKLLASNGGDKIFLNALLSGSPSEVLAEARKLKEKNYKAIKLKVATHPIGDEINLVLKLNELFKGEVQLRLDANQSWTFEQAVLFGKAVQTTNIEYIEEPCSQPELFGDFYSETHIPVALDESLSQNALKKIEVFDGLNTIIIKPSVIGRLTDIQKWIHWASLNNLKVVFSSVFESGIGMRAISNLAGAWSKNNIAHGLDTFRWLEKDVTIPAFTSNTAFIQLADQDFQLNENMLNKVYEYNF
jgi:o-succinylbenzoate synthase